MVSVNDKITKKVKLLRAKDGQDNTFDSKLNSTLCISIWWWVEQFVDDRISERITRNIHRELFDKYAKN
jgi:hypothetical protein